MQKYAKQNMHKYAFLKSAQMCQLCAEKCSIRINMQIKKCKKCKNMQKNTMVMSISP